MYLIKLYSVTSCRLSATTDEAKIGMYKILEQIKNHPDAWPFLDPVDEDFAPDYYTKISQPMDLEKMEQRVSTKYYQSVNEFMSDFDLIVDNCKKYNGPESGNETTLCQHMNAFVYFFTDFYLFQNIPLWSTVWLMNFGCCRQGISIRFTNRSRCLAVQNRIVAPPPMNPITRNANLEFQMPRREEG